MLGNPGTPRAELQWGASSPEHSTAHPNALSHLSSELRRKYFSTSNTEQVVMMLSLWQKVQVSVQMDSMCKGDEREGGLLLSALCSSSASRAASPTEGSLQSAGHGTDAAALAHLFQLAGRFAFLPSYRKEGQCRTACPAGVCAELKHAEARREASVCAGLNSGSAPVRTLENMLWRGLAGF